MTALPPRGRGGRRWRPLLVGLAMVVTVGLVAAVGQVVGLRVIVVPTGSMRPALEPGDRVLVETRSLPGRALERGELIVRRDAGDRAVIQRVIGLPGEIVELRAGVVHVDGKPLSEPYATPGEHDAAPTHLPPDRYWVVDDHRPESDTDGGPGQTVAADELIGRAVTVLWPPAHVVRELHAEPEPAARASRQLPR